LVIRSLSSTTSLKASAISRSKPGRFEGNRTEKSPFRKALRAARSLLVSTERVERALGADAALAMEKLLDKPALGSATHGVLQGKSDRGRAQVAPPSAFRWEIPPRKALEWSADCPRAGH
jgi:hypothetical protein